MERKYFYRIHFGQLGEHCLTIEYGGGKYTHLYYFVTEPVETLLKKRSAFLVSKQHRNTGKWYEGLLGEWNNADGVLLGPDCYDRISGWRIYEVTCDDPGLSKPAFLSSKLAIYRCRRKWTRWNTMWSILFGADCSGQRMRLIPMALWNSGLETCGDASEGRKEAHLWRIYDYPHIALMYYNLYRIAADYPEIHTRLSAGVYLKRACRTALAMFRIPRELDDWSAKKTGLYNELVIPQIIVSLREEGLDDDADQLERYWKRKARYFVEECRDVFGSEYPFDTTGFESTFVLAETALKDASYTPSDARFSRETSYGAAWEFLESSRSAILPAVGFWSLPISGMGAIIGGDNMHYTLSYMAQMGGYSLLRYALYYAEEPLNCFGWLTVRFSALML